MTHIVFVHQGCDQNLLGKINIQKALSMALYFKGTHLANCQQKAERKLLSPTTRAIKMFSTTGWNG